MAKANAHNLRLAYVEETVFGAAPFSPRMQVLPLLEEGLAIRNRGFVTPDGGDDRMLVASSAGPVDVEAKLALLLELESIGTILKHTLGGATTTGGFPPFTHTLPDSSSLPPGLSIEKALLDVNYFLHIKGCRVNSLKLLFPQKGGPVRVELSLLTKGVDILSGPMAGSLVETQVLPLSHSLSLLKDSLPVSGLLGMELTIENNLYRDGYVLGSRERYYLEPGIRKLTGKLLMETEDTDYLEEHLNSGNTSLRISVAGPNSAGSLEFLLPKIVFAGYSQFIVGHEVQQEVSFVALRDDTLGTDIKVTLVNNQPQV